MVIAVDFDGTIVEHRFPAIGPLIPYGIKLLKIWQRNGHKIILWTCREGKALEDAVSFCKTQDFEFDAVNENIRTYMGSSGRKVWADYYVDDRCGLDVRQIWKAVHRKVMG